MFAAEVLQWARRVPCIPLGGFVRDIKPWAGMGYFSLKMIGNCAKGNVLFSACAETSFLKLENPEVRSFYGI